MDIQIAHLSSEIDPKSIIRCSISGVYLSLFRNDNVYKLNITRYGIEVTIDSVIYDATDMTFGYGEELLTMCEEYITICMVIESSRGDYAESRRKYWSNVLLNRYGKLLIELNEKWMEYIGQSDSRWRMTKSSALRC